MGSDCCVWCFIACLLCKGKLDRVLRQKFKCNLYVKHNLGGREIFAVIPDPCDGFTYSRTLILMYFPSPQQQVSLSKLQKFLQLKSPGPTTHPLRLMPTFLPKTYKTLCDLEPEGSRLEEESPVLVPSDLRFQE